MQRWRLQQSPRLVLALCAAAAVAWMLVQLSDAAQASRKPLVCPAVGSQSVAQLKTELTARLASKPGDAPAAYHCYAKALTEAHCRDLGPLNLDPQVKIKALADKSILVKIDPLPVYLNVYNGSQDIVSGHLVAGEGWEQRDIDQVVWALQQSARVSTSRSVFRPLLPPPAPPVFLDVGANVGSFSMQVAARGFNVIGFEAMPDNQKLLRTALCASHPDIMTRVTIHSFGLGVEPMTCYIISADNNRGDGVSACVKTEAEAQNLTHSNYRIRGAFDVLRGDDVLQGQHIQVMKIDVEGHEPFVFQGMKQIIKQQKIKYIFMEYNRAMLPGPPPGGDKYDFVKEIMRHGYKVSRHAFEGPFMTTQELASLDQVTITNLFLVHKSVTGRLF